MKRKVFRNLIEAEEAFKIFTESAPMWILGSEKIKLIDSLGRVLAEDVFSPINIPPFDRAAMDGFAVNSNDTVGSEEDRAISLDIVGSIKAGYLFDGIVNNGQCVEISTGAPMPSGTDSVVMVEYANRKGEKVNIYKSSTPGLNTMAAGADIQEGERVLSAFTLLTSRELSVLAAMGFKYVNVVKKPKIGIFSSGDEVTLLGEKLKPGKLYDINSTAIASGVLENGGDAIFLGVILDNVDDLRTKLAEAIKKFDLVIISGGTSAGMGDILYNIIDELGKPGILVHGVKVKPGKPTILAVCNNTPLIGLPGYPASALSIFKLFVMPYIRQRVGLKPQLESEIIKATVKRRIRSVMGRHEFKPMNLIKSPSGWNAFPVPGGSGAITSISLADGFVEIETDVSFIPPNTEVDIKLFSKNLNPYDIQIIGSHCHALAKLQQLFSQKYPKYKSRSISVGSTGGVSAIRNSEAHIAGVHLLDKNGNYNSWLKNELDIDIIPGYYRMQGFIVKKGNPKNIFNIKDLTRKNVKFINRNIGSGTRILFDLFLEKMRIDPMSISGYNTNVRSHSSIANQVKNGIADVGIAIKAVIDDDLEFIDLREEEYDYLVNKQYLELDEVQKFIETIKSDEFKDIVNQLPGYRSKY